MPEVAATEKPEFLYCLTTDPATRRRLEAAVIAENRGKVEAMVRKLVPVVERREEAVNAGLLGLLIALWKFEPARLGGAEEDQGAAFWFFASNTVRDEIQKFLDHEVFSRPRSRNRRDKTFGESAGTRSHESLEVVGEPRDDKPSVEEVVAEAEAKVKLSVFASTLDSEDREILFSENSQRVRSRRYLSLVERATAFVRGNDAPPVSANRETIRP